MVQSSARKSLDETWQYLEAEGGRPLVEGGLQQLRALLKQAE